MDQPAREHVAKGLAAVFKQHQMRGHLEELRRYWRRQPGCWPDDFVGHWAALVAIETGLFPTRELAGPSNLSA